MRKSIIVAASQNGIIGKDNQLPWRLPGDLKRFKQLTMGHTLIMGRKTYESIGRPLPGRTNIVLSRNTEAVYPPGVLCYGKLEVALDWAARIELVNREARGGSEDEVFVCGGGEVYREALPLVDRVYLTVVERDFEGDTRIDIPFWGKQTEVGHQVGFTGAIWSLTSIEHVEGELPHRFEIWDRVQ